VLLADGAVLLDRDHDRAVRADCEVVQIELLRPAAELVGADLDRERTPLHWPDGRCLSPHSLSIRPERSRLRLLDDLEDGLVPGHQRILRQGRPWLEREVEDLEARGIEAITQRPKHPVAGVGFVEITRRGEVHVEGRAQADPMDETEGIPTLDDQPLEEDGVREHGNDHEPTDVLVVHSGIPCASGS
jgi:hypothetical protein